MDYSQLSDFEINKRVSVAAGLNVNMFFDVDEAYARGPVWTAPSGNLYAGIKSSKGNPFDPCNDPADAWPIIEKNYIALHPLKHKSVWIAVSDDQEHTFRDVKPMRAAMVIFLMSRESFNA